MNKKNYVAVATLAFAMLTSCAGQKEAKSTSGIDLANMDTTVSAGVCRYGLFPLRMWRME